MVESEWLKGFKCIVSELTDRANPVVNKREKRGQADQGAIFFDWSDGRMYYVKKIPSFIPQTFPHAEVKPPHLPLAVHDGAAGFGEEVAANPGG